MAEHVSTIMLCTVDTPTRNLADSVLNESPVAKKLKYINKFSNLYDFVDQFKSNSYWSPTGSPATAIRNLLCTPPVWFENLLFNLYTLASQLCTSLLTFVSACHVTSKKAAIFQYEANLTKRTKMPKIMDTRDSLTLEEEYKATVGVFKEADKVTSATDEMLDLNRIAYKACENFSDCF